MIHIIVRDNICFISFSYNPNIVNIVKEIPNRYYDSKTKTWEINIVFLPMLEEKLKGYNYTIKYQNLIQREIFDEKFDFKTPPYPHQMECFEYAKDHMRFILGDEMGLGKTKMAIDVAMFRRQVLYYNYCLVVCGVNGLKWNWQKEIEIHSNEKGYILGSRKKKRSGEDYVGGNKEKVEDLTKLLKGSQEFPYFLIINIEALRDTKILGLLSTAIKKDLINMIIFDEFHKVKNPESKQGSAILKLKAESQIAMTGTPLLNSPLDLYSPLNWIDIEKHSYYQFKNHFCLITLGTIVGYRHLDQLKDILDTCMLRRLKNDVLDLPPKIFITDYVEMCKYQQSIYNEIKTELRRNIDKIILSNNPLAELIRLRQATGFTGILSNKIRVSAKYDRLMDIIEETVENGDKVIVFSNWTDVLMPIYNVIEEEGYNPALIIGEVQDKFNQKEKFQNDDTCKVILGTIGAMGTGYTLTAGNTVVFLDSPWNKGTKIQAEDRAHRIGTNGSINIITIVCKDTIDERIEEIVYQKGLLSDMIVDGKMPDIINRREMIETLLR